jgi:hypothetical protein
LLRFAEAQGSFVYDQQSAVEGNPGEGGLNIQAFQPLGQSFTPALSSVGFVRLRLTDPLVGNSLGSTIYVNLRVDSITGSIMGSTAPVSIPDGFGIGGDGYVSFLFSTPLTVTPGVLYYFQPVVQSGDPTSIGFGNGFGYPGGMFFFQGQPSPSSDLWFREGIIVPEPGTWALLLLGSWAICWRRARLR